MTALKEYARLECTGLWRPEPDSQRREVGVSFGAATLVISDTAGRALAHWSLPAVQRLNGDNVPALFAPDTDGSETLELTDDEMIDAIETVRDSVERAKPRPGRLRALMAGCVAAGVFWLPGALTRQTLSVVPPAKRSEIGATLLGHIQRLAGTSCRAPFGTAALAQLKTRVLGRDAPGQILVIPGDLSGPIYLPGGIILLSAPMVEEPEDPAAVGGHILAAALSRTEADPLEPVLDRAGFGTTLRLLTTGDIPSGALSDYAEALIGAAPALADVTELRAGFEQAQVPPQPWLNAIGSPLALSTLYDLEFSSPPDVLPDSDWIALQNICRG